MSLLSNLKKKRNTQLEEISKKMDSSGKSSTRTKDSRFWNLTVEDGNGAAIIRFLPPIQDGDDMPWVHVQTYAFQGPSGKWYYNNSLRTIGQDDPVSQANYNDYNVVATEASKKLCSLRKIKHKYISNILVVKDPKNPDNEGKVFLFSYGPQIHKMLTELAKPEQDELSDEVREPIFAWDYEEGANFRFKAYTKEGDFLSYDKSTFDSPSALCGGDEEKIEAVLGQCHKLSQFVAPDQFKTYDELKKDLDRAMGTDTVKKAIDSLDEDMKDIPKEAKKPPVKKVEKPAKEETGDDDQESLDYFAKLLSEE